MIEEAQRIQKEAHIEELRHTEGISFDIFLEIHKPESGCQLRKIPLGVIGTLPASDNLGDYELLASGWYCETHEVGTEGVKEALSPRGG